MLPKFWKRRIAKVSLVGLLTLFLTVGGTWFTSIKASSEQTRLAHCQPVISGTIYRYIQGEDACLTPLSNLDLEKLTDLFAKAVLRQGLLPQSTEALSQVIKSNLGYSPTTYLAGEGSQIPTTVASRQDPRALRYLVTWGENENDGQIMMSKLVPASQPSLMEVVSFDEQTKKYNYYILRPQVDAKDDAVMVWTWTGDSTHARQAKTIGKGCFRCHHNGLPFIRELETPWNNWHSERAYISAALVPKAVASESFFLQRRGAEILEGVIRGNIQNYYINWLAERRRQKDGTTYLSDVAEMLRHLTTTTTINFTSSDVQSNGKDTSPPNRDLAGIPPRDTFLSDSLLQTTLGLDYSSLSVTLPRKAYDAYLKKHNFTLVGTQGFSRETPMAYPYLGSTYFAYYVPQVSAEDIYVTQLLLNSKIVTDKFVAALLMVDYQNPLFSDKRGSLQKYAEKIGRGTIANGVSSVPQDFVDRIKETGAKACQANNFEACSAEEQFLYIWELPDDKWQTLTAKRLQTYVDSVASLEPNDQLEYLMRRSIEQRDRVASTPTICEFFETRLMFPETNLSKLPSCPTAIH